MGWQLQVERPCLQEREDAGRAGIWGKKLQRGRERGGIRDKDTQEEVEEARPSVTVERKSWDS